MRIRRYSSRSRPGSYSLGASTQAQLLARTTLSAHDRSILCVCSKARIAEYQSSIDRE